MKSQTTCVTMYAKRTVISTRNAALQATTQPTPSQFCCFSIGQVTWKTQPLRVEHSRSWLLGKRHGQTGNRSSWRSGKGGPKFFKMSVVPDLAYSTALAAASNALYKAQSKSDRFTLPISSSVSFALYCISVCLVPFCYKGGLLLAELPL